MEQVSAMTQIAPKTFVEERQQVGSSFVLNPALSQVLDFKLMRYLMILNLRFTCLANKGKLTEAGNNPEPT